uniref:Uncharacterized protein n=2 Tax=Oryza TaxID=4527 RepID=Q69LQ5_ORYSJ|nr:hypothetical protein [Oryza sativa Japonica Group]
MALPHIRLPPPFSFSRSGSGRGGEGRRGGEVVAGDQEWPFLLSVRPSPFFPYRSATVVVVEKSDTKAG